MQSVIDVTGTPLLYLIILISQMGRTGRRFAGFLVETKASGPDGPVEEGQTWDCCGAPAQLGPTLGPDKTLLMLQRSEDVTGHERAPISQEPPSSTPHPSNPCNTQLFLGLGFKPQPLFLIEAHLLSFSLSLSWCAWLMVRWHPHMSVCCPSNQQSPHPPPSAGSVV